MNDDASDRIRRYFDNHNLNLDAACLKASEKAVHILDGREYESIYICLREFPMETMRPRTMNGHTFSPNGAANKAYFSKAMEQIGKQLKMICTPGEIRIDAFLEMPSPVPPDEVILYEAQLLHVVHLPDADNVCKSYLDMLTGTLTIDDDLFWHTDVYKWYSLEPRVELRICYEKFIESDYLYKRLKGRKSIKEGIESGQIELRRL